MRHFKKHQGFGLLGRAVLPSEDTGAGTSLIQELRTSISGVLSVTPGRDKETRMSRVSAKFEAGEVFLPNQAPWLPDLEAELFSFPGGRNDDQCDSISQALKDRQNRVLNFSGVENISIVRDRYAKNFRFK
jgi:predicted phage terminase large subunit-like protein